MIYDIIHVHYRSRMKPMQYHANGTQPTINDAVNELTVTCFTKAIVALQSQIITH